MSVSSTEIRKRRSQVRRLLSIMKGWPSSGVSSGEFAIVYDSNKNIWYLYNGHSQNIIATIRFRGHSSSRRTIVRYRGTSWYRDLLSDKKRYGGNKQIIVPSKGKLYKNKQWVAQQAGLSIPDGEYVGFNRRLRVMSEIDLTAHQALRNQMVREYTSHIWFDSTASTSSLDYDTISRSVAALREAPSPYLSPFGNTETPLTEDMRTLDEMYSPAHDNTEDGPLGT